MHSFANDYSEGAHPKVLELMMNSNLEQNEGYGLDKHCARAKELICRWINLPDADVHFIPGGTQTNLLVISSFLRPHQCVIAADTGHINVHETGAVEATGHKVVAMPGKDGKLTPQLIQSVLDSHESEHMVQPKMVYLSNSTELGTIYTKSELKDIRRTCLNNNLLLYMDGARIGTALACSLNDLSIEEIARQVDVFYIGGTKNGALLGEALVICKEELKEDFRYLMKQRAAMPAKGFVVGIQFEALMQDGLYMSLAAHANNMAAMVADIFREKGFGFYAQPCTNQVFPIVPNELAKRLIDNFGCLDQTRVDDNNICVRFVASWATTQSSIDELRKFLR